MTVRSALRPPVRAAVRAPIILRKRWTPAALFAQGQQGVWYEPRPQYLYQDAAGTIPVTADGDPVGLMLDRSPNEFSADQGAEADRLNYAQGEYAHLTRVSATGHLDLGTQLLYATGENATASFVFAIELSSSVGYLIHLDGDVSSRELHSFSVLDMGNGTVTVNIGGEVNAVSCPSSKFILSISFDKGAGTAKFRINTGAWQNINAGSVSHDFRVGRLFARGGGAEFSGKMYGMLSCDYELTGSQFDKAEGYLASTAGVSSGSFALSSFSYASSIEAGISDLYAKYSYPQEIGTTQSGLPVVVIMHGFTGDANDATDAIMEDMASYGFFALSVGMRGRNGGGGSPDVSGREIHDIYDAVEYVKANFGDLVDPDSVHITGYSGGGGNVMAAACKFPDAFTVKASHFGISDYGYDSEFGWGEMSPSRQSQLATWIGYRPREGWDGTEPVNLDAYRARNAVEGIAGATLGGHLFLYHDLQDGNTQPSLTTRVADAFDAASNTRYTQSLTDTGDDPRWLHDMPHPDGDPSGPSGGAPVRFTRQAWGAAILNTTYPAWQMPDTATVRVLGYMVTKRFSIWLGDGTEHVADLTYDLVANTFVVTPLTGQVDVTVTLPSGESAAQTISTETTLEPAP